MADALVDCIHNCLPAGLNVLIVFVEIDDPAESLLRRGDVVAFGAEAENWRADVAQIDPHAVAGGDLGRCQPITDEQLVDNPLHFLSVKVDMATPPRLEFEEPLRLCIDLRPKIVILGPIRVRRIEVFKVAN
jgi:hypothetical protein